MVNCLLACKKKLTEKCREIECREVADEWAELTGKRKQVDNLVLRSANFREKATTILRSAVNLLSVNIWL